MKTKTTKKTATEKPPAAPPATVMVRVTRPMSEAGVYHAPGAEFETTAERAKALGKQVEIL